MNNYQIYAKQMSHNLKKKMIIEEMGDMADLIMKSDNND